MCAWHETYLYTFSLMSSFFILTCSTAVLHVQQSITPFLCVSPTFTHETLDWPSRAEPLSWQRLRASNNGIAAAAAAADIVVIVSPLITYTTVGMLISVGGAAGLQRLHYRLRAPKFFQELSEKLWRSQGGLCSSLGGVWCRWPNRNTHTEHSELIYCSMQCTV